ncbi:ogr/Delta-like zinc finger family protein [Kiloniella sp. b19]|uniref:ogr/Delta-like zinc finger family protein n=1 Tax=Kiloniella sp. GXU_MW_B19 TaxID=3141326 RepID=UPI0031E0C5F9
MSPPKRNQAPAPGVKCPHCKSPANNTRTVVVSETLKEIRYHCTNEKCGHIFLADLEIKRTLVPSDCPNADIKIPQHDFNAAKTN